VEDGHFAHVWTGLVLHVLSEAGVESLVRSVFAMLRPGGTYFGTCAGSESPTVWQPEFAGRSPGFLHTGASLKALLESIGYEDVVVHEMPMPTLLNAAIPALVRMCLCSMSGGQDLISSTIYR
jgi:hypothetical protein